MFFFCCLFSSDSVIETCLPVEPIKKILSSRSKMVPIFNELFSLCKRNTNVESEPSQASIAAGNDEQGQNVLEQSKDKMSENSQGAINSGHGNNRENNKGKKNKSKKSKGGKKGRK